MERYSRHYLLKEIGKEGQKKLEKSKVLIVGMGGLGNPILLYLAAAGVGKIGIVEDDIIEESNLQRQIIYNAEDIGKYKIDMAEYKALQLNENIKINKHRERLNEKNVKNIFQEYDYIVDACDNFETRYLISDECKKQKKYHIYGSVCEFEGQVSVFDPKKISYRDLYPISKDKEKLESKGIVGSIVGVIGSIQANEVIKLILKIGTPLIGKILVYDGLEVDFIKLELSKNKKGEL